MGSFCSCCKDRRPQQGMQKLTNLPSVYRMFVTDPSAGDNKKCDNQSNENHHPLFGHKVVPQLLPSHKNFATITDIRRIKPTSFHLHWWNELIKTNKVLLAPKEAFPAGSELPRKAWVKFNCVWRKFAKTWNNLHKWGYVQDAWCPCGANVQTIAHILTDFPVSKTWWTWGMPKTLSDGGSWDGVRLYDDMQKSKLWRYDQVPRMSEFGVGRCRKVEVASSVSRRSNKTWEEVIKWTLGIKIWSAIG